MTAGDGRPAGLAASALGAVASSFCAGLAAAGLGSDRSFASGLAFGVAAGLEATPAVLGVPEGLDVELGDELVEDAEEAVLELEPDEDEEEEVLVEVVVVLVVAAGLGVDAGLGFGLGLGFGVVSVAAGVVSVGAGSGAGSSASAAGAKAAASAAPARTAAAQTRIALDGGQAPQLTPSVPPSLLSPVHCSVYAQHRGSTPVRKSKNPATCARPVAVRSRGT